MLALLRASKRVAESGRFLSTTSLPERKVAILGAAGGIGQPLSLLMKINPAVSELALYDVANVHGVGVDVSHINTKAKVKTYQGDAELEGALTGADLVVIPAGVPRKPGMLRQELFDVNTSLHSPPLPSTGPVLQINARIVQTLTQGIGKYCPTAIINMISNPVNSTVPVAAETLKQMGVYDQRKVMGVTTLDVVRAKTFYAEKQGLDVADVDIPVVGGHAGITILPLFSQATPYKELSGEDLDALTKRTQDGGTEVVEAKAGQGSATLSMAYAGALFADACLRGLNGQKKVVECTYVETDVVNGVPYFSSKALLSREGVEECYPVGDITDYEKAKLKEMLPELNASIEAGYNYAHKK
eukprot:g5221.t1